MNSIKMFNNLRLMAILFAGLTIASCGDDDDAVPEEEEELEVITDVTLVFTNITNSTDVVRASAQDPDGEGAAELVVNDPINLTAGAAYMLTFEIFNNLETPGEDIGEEIAEEDDEHQIFFAFTADAFSSPAGDGNIDNSSDAILYNDEDENGNPVGLSTTWTASTTELTGGTFTVRLQHQPEIKSATTGATDGESDFDLEFVLNIQ